MRILFFFILLSGFSSGAGAQDLGEVYFNKGLEAFQKKQYREADSLFSESLFFQPHKDTYFSRAAVRKKLRNQAGYCSDLAQAAVRGDQEADSLFKQGCGSVVTKFVDLQNKEVDKTQSTYRVIRYENLVDSTVLAVRFDNKNNFINIYYIVNDTSGIVSEPDSVPEFPGGMKAFYKLINSRIVYPQDARENGASGKVIIQFVIEKNGSMTHPRIVKDVKDYPSMTQAALKSIENMPAWRPGIVKGKPVRSYVEVPVAFTIQ